MNQVFENGWVARVICVLCLSLALSGCVTTEERPDGSTLVRFHGSEALGLKPAAGNSGNTPAQVQNAPATTNTNAAPSAPMLSTTPLAGLFAKHPYDGTSKTYYPRVALTIVDWSRNDCWVARAKIWRSSSKSENVAPFSVCFNKQSFDFVLNSAAGMHIFMQQMALEHSGNVRTEGPKPPMLATLDRQPMNVDRSQTTYVPFLQQIIAETGWKGGAPTNFWIVGYDSERTTPTAVGATLTPSLSKAQVTDIERALACRPSSTLDKTLQSARIPSDGKTVAALDGLIVFGLQPDMMSFNREGGEVMHFSYFPASVDLSLVVSAAQLKRDKNGNYTRSVRVDKNLYGWLYASMQNGSAVLKCSINYEQNMD